MFSKNGLAETNEKSMFSMENPNEIEFSLNEDAFGAIIDRLTDVYDYPALATAREVISNAYDATVSYERTHGKTGSITIEVPLMENDYNFIVEDKASGMSMQELKENYCSYGNSVKLDDMLVTGSKGMGAKAPFAAVSSFFIETSDGETTISATAVRNPGEVPRLTNVKTVDAQGAHGTKITIPMKNSTSGERETATSTALKMSKYIVGYECKVLNENSINREYPGVDVHDKGLEDYRHIKNVNHLGHNFRLFVRKDIFSTQFSSIYDFFHEDERGFYRSGISESDIDILLNGYVYSSGHYYAKRRFLLEVTPGVVDFPSSRDSITKNKRFFNLLQSVSQSRLDESEIPSFFAAYLECANGGETLVNNLREYSTRHPNILEKAKDLNGKEYPAGVPIELSDKVLDVIDFFVEEEKNVFEGVFYAENKNYRNSNRGMLYTVNNATYELKTKANQDFRHSMNEFVLNANSANTANNANTVNPARKHFKQMLENLLGTKGHIAVFTGKDPEYAKLSAKTKRMNIEAKQDNSIAMLFPAKEDLSDKDKSKLKSLAWALRKNIHFFNSASEIDYFSTKRDGSAAGSKVAALSTKVMTYFSFDSMDSRLEGEELKEDNFLKLLNDAGACLPFRVQNKIAGDVLRYVEEVKDDEDKNLEVLIIPGKIAVFKQRAAESFQEYMLGLMDSEGLDYCANTEVLVLVEPAKVFLDELKQIGVKTTFYSGNRPGNDDGVMYRASTYNKLKKNTGEHPLWCKMLLSGFKADEMKKAYFWLFENNSVMLSSFKMERFTEMMELVSEEPELESSAFAQSFLQTTFTSNEEAEHITELYIIKEFIEESQDLTIDEFFARGGVTVKQFAKEAKFSEKVKLIVNSESHAVLQDIVETNRFAHILPYITDNSPNDFRKKLANNYILSLVKRAEQ